MRAVPRACLGYLALSALAAPKPAHADPVEACVSAVEDGQRLQRSGRLRAAREKFLACDKSECPAEVRAVCDRLVNAVEASLPTVIFGARDAADKDLVAVRVLVDGSPLLPSVDGKAVPLDPGPHQLRFEHEGSNPIDESVVVREAEKNRLIVVTFAESKGAGAGASGNETRRPIPPVVFVLGGLGVASLGVFVGLDVDGQSRYESCQQQKGSCLPSTVHSLSIERGAAIATGVVGLVSLGLATFLFIQRPTEHHAAPALRVDVEGVRGGGLLHAVGSF
jgi:hypothetical protein